MKDLFNFLEERDNKVNESGWTTTISAYPEGGVSGGSSPDYSAPGHYMVDPKTGKPVEYDEKEIKKMTGKDAKKNGTKGSWGVDEPYDDDYLKENPLPNDQLTDNQAIVMSCCDSRQPFFVQGRAGWAKTSIIKDIAKRRHFRIVTVYLDKCEATDLFGIPVPIKNDDGTVETVNAMPGWAAVIANNPDSDFLLFFDEMNQAAPDVQNALMPIVNPDQHEICGIKLDNYFVGAAGNLSEENSSLWDLNGPLGSRFEVIDWSSGTEEDWNSAFRHLHNKYDKKGDLKEVIDELDKNRDLFINPREIEQSIIGKVVSLMGKDCSYLTPQRLLKEWQRRFRDDLTHSQSNARDSLVNFIYNILVDNAEGANKTRRRQKNKDMLDGVLLDAIVSGMKNGWVLVIEDDGSSTIYGVSRESINRLIDSEEATAEQIETAISNLETQGIKFRYEKDKDWKPKNKSWNELPPVGFLTRNDKLEDSVKLTPAQKRKLARD